MPSAVPDDIEALVAVGFLEQLAEWDLVTWEPGQIAPDAVRPARLGPDEPANMPDERVLVTPRAVLPVRGRIVDVGIGIAWRGPVDGDALDGLNFIGAIRRRLYRIPPMTFGTVRVSGARIESSGMLPRDTARRPAATASILFRALIARVNT